MVPLDATLFRYNTVALIIGSDDSRNPIVGLS